MKLNKIFFVASLRFYIYVSTFFCVCLNATTPQQEITLQSWRDRIGSFVSRAKAIPGRVLQETKRRYSYVTPENVGIVVKDTAQNVGKLAGASTLNALASVSLVPFASNLVKSGISPLAVTAFFGAGTAVLGVVFSSMIKFNAYDKVKNRDDKINAIKEIVRAQLSDEIAYPTRSSKLHALLKKNEFSFAPEKDIDGIFSDACAELITDMKLDKESTLDESDDVIGAKISDLNAQLLKQGGSLQDKIDGILTSDLKAHMSVYFRLKKQQEFQELNPAVFEEESAAKFYENSSVSTSQKRQKTKEEIDNEYADILNPDNWKQKQETQKTTESAASTSSF